MTALSLFADEMRAAREQRGWSQADLADKIPYSLSTISMVEALHRAPTRDLAGHLDRGVETSAFRPGRKCRVTSRKCQWCPIVCSYVPVPAAPHARPAGGAAGPLRPRPVRMEPGRRTALPLAPRPAGRAGLPGAAPAAHPGASRAPVAARRLPYSAAASPARLRSGDGRVLRPGQPGRAAVLAQGWAARGIPHRGARSAMGRAPRVP